MQWLTKTLYDFEIWMDKVKVTKAESKFEDIHLKQTSTKRFTHMLYTVKILSDLE